MEQQRHVRDAAAGPAPLPRGSSGVQQAAAAVEPQREPPAAAPGGQASRRRQLYDDDFMIWVWKIEMCKRMDQHDRKECPYAHPGELARRRHPSLYQALPCPEARAKKICPRLENCNCSHSTFEFWLHPDRYKTFLCERGEACDRPICFFAHSPAELRELPQGMQRTQPASRLSPQSAQGSSSGSSGRLTAPGSSQAAAGALPGQYAGAGPSHIAGAGPSSSRQHYPRSGPPQQQYPAHHPAQHRGQASSSAQQGGSSRQPGSFQPRMHPGGAQQEAGGVQDTHRGPTVAVIPAGRSVWQNNSALQFESGEAPNLEELCAAMTRMTPQQGYQGQVYQGQPQGAAISAALQHQQRQSQQQQPHQPHQQRQQHLHQHQHHQQQPLYQHQQPPHQHQQPPHQHQHQHQHRHQQPGLPAASAMPPSQYPFPLMGAPQVFPGRVPVSGYPGSGYLGQQRQQQPGQQPMQQQVMLPGGQVVYMQMVPPGEPGAAYQIFWGGLLRQ